jgi:methylenetetrahydrofolate reductase (NADPH)
MNKKGITIPVLPGILPLTDVEKVKQFASICRTTIPGYIESAMESLRNNPGEMEKAGIDFTIEQCKDLIENGIRRLYFFTLNRYEIVEKVLKALGL